MLDHKYAFKIFPDKNLIVKYYNGVFSLSDIITSINFTSEHIDWKPTMNIIHDVKDIIFEIDANEIQELIRYNKEDKKIYGERKVAFITSSPNQVVFTLMLTNFKNESLINMDTFSTLSPAIEWVELPLTYLKMIENCIDELKKYLKNS